MFLKRESGQYSTLRLYRVTYKHQTENYLKKMEKNVRTVETFKVDKFNLIPVLGVNFGSLKDSTIYILLNMFNILHMISLSIRVS